MNKIFVVLAIALSLLAVVRADDDVMVLTDKNFDETVSSNDFVFVEFYAPWCGHCKNLAPDWAKLATHFKQQGSNVIIAKVDATENTQVANANGVRGYPTLIFFKNGSPLKYEQDRSLNAMINYVNKKSGPASVELKTTADHDAFTAKGGVVAYITGGEDSVEYKNWLRAATSGQIEDFALGHAFAPEVRGNRANTAVIYKAGEEPLQFKDDSLTKTKITSWILAEGYPLWEEISQTVWQRSQQSNKPLLAVFAESTQTPLVAALAKHYKGKLIVTLAPLPAQKSLAERWGASGKVFPTGILADWKGQSNPSMTVFNEADETFTVESATAFVDAALEDQYAGYLKSEPEPEQTGPVTVLVGKSFEKIVNDKAKDVFVEFYAPWCGHCKSLAPKYEELAENFADVKSILIAKIDATENEVDHPGVDVKGFPTLLFFPAKDKQNPIVYEGARDVEGITEFLKKNAQKFDLDGAEHGAEHEEL